MGQVKTPGQQGQEEPQAQVIEKFGGLNTKASRPAIENEEFAWLQNFMPIGNGNLRTVYGPGDTLYTVPNPLQDQIIFTYAFNIGEVSYQAVFLDNGTAYQVNRETEAVTTISATLGKFYTAGGDLPFCAQWQSKFLIIVSTVSNDGYWLWNGSALFGAGTLSPIVTVTNSGRDYTSVPTVTAYGGSGSGATFLATIGNNADEGVLSVSVVTPGSGYQVGEEVTLAFSGGGSDNGAAATATIDTANGGVTSVIVTDGGADYTADAEVTFTGGGGTGAAGFVSGASAGVITAITITNGGSGYTSPPTVGITASSGSGFAGTALMRTGQITAIAVAAGGTNYAAAPIVTITGDGVGAEAVATITAGAVTSIAVTNPGYGYTAAAINFVGNNDAATATVTLMPHSVKGNSVETFQSRVWVSDDTRVLFTAPASVSDFATSSGGGVYAATESFLRERITRMIQSSGFLYQVADSSINVISNVQTSGDPPTTTFNNANIDPQVGSPWRDTVQPFGRALVFGNSSGIYALYGGAAEKVSGALDGLFANATFNTGAAGGVTPTGAVATVFGIRCYVFNFTTINPYTDEQETMMACWDGQKWFIHAPGDAAPDDAPVFIAAEEIDSELTAWATDGTNLYPLFQEPSADMEKVFQTKLRSDPVYIYYKQANRLYLMAESFGETPPTFELAYDNENGDGQLESELIAGPAIQWISDGGDPLEFTGAGGSTLYFRSSGLGVFGFTTSAYGTLIGVTGKTSADDCRVLSITALIAPTYALYG